MDDSLGTHVIIDLWVKDGSILEDIKEVRERIESVIKDKVTIVNFAYHDFGPNAGVTAIWLLAESHISVHCWSELNYIAIDCFTCGKVNPEDFVDPLYNILNGVQKNVITLGRGNSYNINSRKRD